ncbi:ComEA family DNA-binding protein [Bifidobacterium pullorum]|uniref:ComEA family DNA-binding protein n=1 Tax=Bifidobacterium pullorum TaxID=78448 RepID=UPI00052A0C51|nr:helix-hairpin-helix domain-containing protein [Bifidobacterium pullorum]
MPCTDERSPATKPRRGLSDLSGVRDRDGDAEDDPVIRHRRDKPRLAVRPIHALIMIMLLTCALCASITMLIQQSLHYVAYRQSESILQATGRAAGGDDIGGDGDDVATSAEAREEDAERSDEPSDVGTSSDPSVADTSDAAGTSSGTGVAAPAPVPGFDAQGRVDLNAATLEQLDTITGVGPAIAQRIIDHRNAIGGFTDVDQLLDVPGIGPKTLAKMRDQVAVP